MQSTRREGLRVFNRLSRPTPSVCCISKATTNSLSGHKQLSTTARALQSRDSGNEFDQAQTLLNIGNLQKDIPRPPHDSAKFFERVVGGGLNQPGLTKSTLGQEKPPEPHHMHVVCSKHNTHITLTMPDRNPIISVAAGNLGFRKHHRSSFDAAYQLGAWVLTQIQERGLLPEIRELEVVFRGFGDGREAVRKVIMGSEGMSIRPKIVKVSDATKLKFGGTRSKKPRRLG
ncbi:mitochondrial ribosomal protein subunit S18 [Phyllosticta citrichinensis]|uniref:Mitochondrial ribosomal protein subunit S18 n=1 Tax=Phyllosticta citrichinensis TaxID=1130410 RepID=A0ABR1XUM6_9PEZI